MVTTFVLVIYLIGQGAGSGGGPTSAAFRDRRSCEIAATAIQKQFGGRYQGHVCVETF